MKINILLLIIDKHFYANEIFQKNWSKIFEKYFLDNIVSFSYWESQLLSADMQIIFLLLIMKKD